MRDDVHGRERKYCLAAACLSGDDIERRNTMSKLAIVAAALVAVLSGPALAKGRTIPQNAYASAVQSTQSSAAQAYDRQLDGRN